MRPIGALLFAIALLSGPEAQAGGMEYPAAGTRPLGRGGASVARADDPIAIITNPAALSGLGPPRLLLDVHLAFLRACAERSGTYTDNLVSRDLSIFGDSDRPTGGGGYALEPFPRICNERAPGPGPALAFTFPLRDDVGIGIGLFAPVTAGAVSWGKGKSLLPGVTGVVRGVTGEPRPNPLRYLLIDSGGVLLFPTLAAGYQALPWLRLGMAFQWGVASFDFLAFGVATGGENPSLDGRANMTLTDRFVPAFVSSVALSPLPGLDLAFAFRWSDDIRGTADMNVVIGEFGTGQPGSTLPQENVIKNADAHFPLPWNLSLGARYGFRRASRESEARVDPMRDEHGDLELDVVFERNSRVDEVVVTPPPGTNVVTRSVLPDGTDSTLEVPVTSPFVLPHKWRDQVSIRLGGDYNVLPGLWALRGGLSFESRGVNPAYANIDFMPGRRLGVHAGSTVRFDGRFDVSVAYAHFFQETVVTAPATSGAKNAAQLQQISADGTGRIVNAGRYRAAWNVISVGLGYAF